MEIEIPQPLEYHLLLEPRRETDPRLVVLACKEESFKTPSLPFVGVIIYGRYAEYRVLEVRMEGLSWRSEKRYINVTVKVEVIDD